MEQLVAELKKILPLKETTKEGDIVLLYEHGQTVLRDERERHEYAVFAKNRDFCFHHVCELCGKFPLFNFLLWLIQLRYAGRW